MTHTHSRRILSLLTALALVVSLLSGLSLTVFADTLIGTPTGYTSASQVVYSSSGSYLKNWGARGEDCVFLTTYAQNYYTGSYTYNTLSGYSGSSSSSGYTTSALYSALHSMLETKQTYETTYNGTRDLYCLTDCVNNNSSYISSFYSGIQLNGAWDSGATWNREHTWPQSKSTGSQLNDIMMLRPTSVTENSGRGNKAYGESDGYYHPNSEVGSTGLDLRGDCARIVLYCYVRWSENAENMWGTDGVIENVDVLLNWILLDPVDTWEMARNDVVQSITGARNCFVDYPELAWLLFGRSIPSNLTTPSNGQGGGAPSTVTLTYMANGAVYATETTTAGQTVTLPTAATAVSGWTFYGWVAEELAPTTVRPSFYAPGTGFTPGSDVTLYALYTQSDGGTGTGAWTRMDNAADLSAGLEIVLGEAANSVTAGTISNAVLGTTQSTFSADGQTISVLSGDAQVFTVGGSAGAWTFANENGQLLGATAVKKLAWGSGTTTWTVSISGGSATIQSTTSSYGRFLYNQGSPRFTTYTSGTSTTMLLPQIYYMDGTVGTVTYTTAPAGAAGTDFTVTFTTPAGITAPAPMTINSLTGATLPTADAPEDWTFLGWVTEDYDHVTEQPAQILTGLYKPTADVTLKALYFCEETGPRLTLMTVNDTFSDGDKIVITAAGTDRGLYRESYLRTYASDFEFTNDAEAILADPKTYFPVTQVSGGWWLGDDDNGYLYTPDNQVNLTIRTYNETFMTAFELTTYDGHLALKHTVSYNDNEFYVKCGTDFSGGTQYKWRMIDLAHNALTGVVALDIYKLIENGPAVTYYTTLFAEAHEHTPAAPVIENNVEPTCTAPGSYDSVVYCAECGEELSRETVAVPALGHDYVATVTPPTATEQGYTTHTCSRCGDTYVDSYVPALGSDFTVHFSVPAGVTQPTDMVSNTNTGITLPTVEGPEGYTFLGWVVDDYDNVETRPATILTGNYIATSEITLKALFTWVDGEGSGEAVYQLVDAVEDGGKYILVAEGAISGTTGYAVGNAIVSNNHYLNAVPVTINSDDTCTAAAANLPKVLWEAVSSGNGFTFYNAAVGKYMGLDASEYLYPSDTAVAWAYTSQKYLDNQIDSGGYYYLSYSSSGTARYTTSKSGSVINLYEETTLGVTIYTTIIVEAHVHTPGNVVVENEVPATCTAAGSYDNVVYCTECGEELSREAVAVPALGHLPGEPVQENYVEPTATEDGGYDTVVCCQRCGEELSREHTVLPATGPVEPIETTELRVFSSISVGTDMVVTFSAQKSALTNYTKKWIEIVKHAPDGDLVYTYGDGQPEALGENDTTWQVDFKNIFAKEMGVVIEARVYAEDASGQVYMSPARSTNIRDYLGGRLVATNNKVEQRVLAADMLNYGAAAQMYMDYETDHLVNEELTATQLAKLDEYETKELPLVEKTNSNYRPEGASNILFNSVSLDNEVILSLSVRANEGDTVQVVMKDHDTGTVLETLDAAWNGASFSVDYKGIGADKMRVAYDFTAQINGAETGNTRTWSIEGYVGEIRNGNLPLKTAMANALLTYGDSAAAYFAAQ